MSESPADPIVARSPPRVSARFGLLALAWLLLVGTVFLVLTGGQVTSTGSGDAVPTWPLPLRLPMSGGVFFELGHRQVAGAVGCLALAILLATGLAARARLLPAGTFRVAVAVFALVVAQALLGGVRVLTGTALGTPESLLVTAIATVHALTAQSFLCLVAILVYLLHEHRLDAPGGAVEAARPPALVACDPRLWASTRRATGAVVLQLVLGAVLRLTRPGPVPLLVLLHILGAVVVTVALLDVLFRALQERQRAPFLLLPAQGAVALLVGQILLGFAAFFAVKPEGPDGIVRSPELTWRTVVPSLHLGVGAGILVLMVLVDLLVRRRGTPLPPAHQGAPSFAA